MAIWAAGADGSLTLAGSAGFSPAEAARWRYVPPDVVTVARRGLTEREGQWITALKETGLPSIGVHHYSDGGRAALPAGTGGRIHGVLEIAWPSVTATAVCGLYDPSRRTLRWSGAGHLPPVLARDGEAAPLPVVKGMLLGAAPDVAYEEAEMQLAAGDTLLMYTDGLIERRDRSVEEPLIHLLTTVRTAPGTLDQQLDRLLTYSKSDTDDDTCIVGIRVGRG